MDLIPIVIKGAKLRNLHLDFDDPITLKWYATITLIDDKDQDVTSIQVGNTSWDENQRADPSIDMVALAASLRKEAFNCVTLYLNKHHNAIGADSNGKTE